MPTVALPQVILIRGIMQELHLLMNFPGPAIALIIMTHTENMVDSPAMFEIMNSSIRFHILEAVLMGLARPSGTTNFQMSEPNMLQVRLLMELCL